MESWTAKAIEHLRRRFGERADWYRARIGQLSGGMQISEEEKLSISRDLEQLAQGTNAEILIVAG